MGLLGFSSELQFRVCNDGQSPYKSLHGKKRALFHRGKKEGEDTEHKGSIASHWLSSCQERSLSSSGWALLLSEVKRVPPSGLLTI